MQPGASCGTHRLIGPKREVVTFLHLFGWWMESSRHWDNFHWDLGLDEFKGCNMLQMNTADSRWHITCDKSKNTSAILLTQEIEARLLSHCHGSHTWRSRFSDICIDRSYNLSYRPHTWPGTVLCELVGLLEKCGRKEFHIQEALCLKHVDTF